MKKKLAFILAAAMVLAAVLGACGSKSTFTDTNGAVGAASDSTQYYGWGGSEGVTNDTSSEMPAENWGGESDSWDGMMEDVGGAVNPQTSLADKIIYSAEVTIETVEFDKAVESVEDMLTKYGAFLESSNVTGKSYRETYYGSRTYRWAKFVIRVPVSSFRDMTRDMENVGSVTNSYIYTQNITERFYDTQSRVDSYRIEQERLLAMLEKCETVADMIEIESRLSDVRYQLESLESTLRNWQNQVDYSTINVTLNEVEEYTKPVEIHRTYWQEIGDGLKDTLESIGDFFKGLFKGIVVNLPTILLLVVFAAVVILIVAAIRRRIRERAERRRREMLSSVEDQQKKE